ncbi:MAG TPA: acyl-CoA dehydrogenase family protein, partial [Fimbriimonas sp.]
MTTNLTHSGCAFVSKTPDRIFVPEAFSSDENLMIETASAFARSEVLPLVERLDRQEEGLMPHLIRHAGELGLCGVDAPEEHGGLGLSKNLAARILEMLSVNGSFGVTYGITSGISQVGLALFGTEEQKARYLPQLTSGQWLGAYALSEPNSGSDALSASTKAERRGDAFILNGTKMWITNAKWADLFLVMAKVDGQRFSAFLVERGFPGVQIAREEHKMGLKGSSTARVVLENAEVPVENLLYQEGLGHHVAFNALNLGRFKLSSMSIGPCRDAVQLASAYALERKQFGQPIANFGLIRKKLALQSSLFYAAESMIYRTGAMIDEAFDASGGTIDGNRQAAEEYAVECSACKVFSTECQAVIVDEALQVFGGYGFTEEFPIARHYRDARVSRIYEGTNEINRLSIVDRILRRAKEGRANLEASGDSFISSLAGEALKVENRDQIVTGAKADLLTLAYAEQSARLR